MGMSGGRRPPFEDGRSNQTEDFRVPSSAAASSNWLRTTAAYQIDNSNGIAGGLVIKAMTGLAKVVIKVVMLVSVCYEVNHWLGDSFLPFAF